MMRRIRRTMVTLAVLALVASLIPLMALPAAGASPPEVVATGLNAPYKITEGPDGAMYVAEAGFGGTTCIDVVGPEGEEIEACIGTSGAVMRVADGSFNRTVTGLPSIDLAGEPLGPQGIAFSPDEELHVTVGLGGGQAERTQFGIPELGTLMNLSDGEPTIVADIAAFEEASDPDAGLPGTTRPDTNPFGLAFDGDDALVADAGGNALLRIDPEGAIEVDALFPPRMVDPPPFLPIPGQIPMQSVPTAVELDFGGVIHVSELTGFPFEVGAANIYSVDNGVPSPAATGFTNIIDFAIAEDGTLYVLEFASNGLLSQAPEAALVQVRQDGTRKTLLHGEDLPVPGGVALDSEGMLYISVCTLCGPGQGMVWKVDPSVAADPATAEACDPASVPGTTFDDIAGNIHREAIECAAWWGVVNGFSATQFGPNVDITRAQVASMIARALSSAGVELPPAPPDAFSDDDGSVHETDINALAAMGIVLGRTDGTFDPNTSVSRAEVTSLLARAYAAATGSPLPAGPDAFTDDNGSTHEADINAVAAAGWVQGVGGGLFQPSAEATRAEFSSMIARMLATLVAEAVTTPPGS